MDPYDYHEKELHDTYPFPLAYTHDDAQDEVFNKVLDEFCLDPILGRFYSSATYDEKKRVIYTRDPKWSSKLEFAWVADGGERRDFQLRVVPIIKEALIECIGF